MLGTSIRYFADYVYDPVLGFRRPNGINWTYADQNEEINGTCYFQNISDKPNCIKKLIEYRKNRFLIIALGGSTTIGDSNWPRHLVKQAKELNIHPPILLLNFAELGYGTFNEKILLSNWILPFLEQQNLSHDAVISLDGVNDFNYQIAAYIEFLKTQRPVWFSTYHGYNQKLDSSLGTIRNDFQLITNQLHTIITSSKTIKALMYGIGVSMPYTTWLAYKLISKKNKPISSTLKFIWNDDYKTKFIKLPSNTEQEIVRGLKTNLLDLYGITKARNISYFGFLQPVLLKEYCPLWKIKLKSNSDQKNVGYGIFLVNSAYNRTFGIDIPVHWSELYKSANDLYKQLGQLYRGRAFTSLAHVFNNVKEDVYIYDCMHYTEEGSALIAKEILKTVIQNSKLKINKR